MQPIPAPRKVGRVPTLERDPVQELVGTRQVPVEGCGVVLCQHVDI